MSEDVERATQQVFERLVEAGEAVAVGELSFVSVLELASGARYGLLAGPRWAVLEGERLIPFAPGDEKAFVEALEYPRREFDDLLEAGARARGFDGEAVMFTFPALELVQAMLVSGSPHFTRVALHWMRPTEIRAARAQLVAVTQNQLMAQAVRQLAERLIVPSEG